MPSDEPRIDWLIAPSPCDAAVVAEIVPAIARVACGESVERIPRGAWSVHRPHARRVLLWRRDGGRRLYCKLYLTKLSWRLRTGFWFWPSPAARAVRWFGELGRLGVPTVPLVAAGEFPELRRGVAQPPSFLVTSCPASARDLTEVAGDPVVSQAQRREFADAAAALAERLHAARVGGLDFKPQNLLADETDRSVRLFDLDRLVVIGAGRTRRLRRRDLAKVDRTRRILLGLGSGTVVRTSPDTTDS